MSIAGEKKEKLLFELKKLAEKGWQLFTTPGTHDFLSKQGVASRCLFKASDAKEPNVASVVAEKKVDLIINIPRNLTNQVITDGYTIRRLAIDHHIPLITNLQIAQLFLQCLIELKDDRIPIKSLQDYRREEKSC